MIGVLGAGAFGTALAVTFAQAGRDVTLWGRDATAMARLAQSRRTGRLPGVDLPASLTVTGDLPGLADCDLLVLAVPMQRLSDLLDAFPLRPAVAVAACKGVDLATLRGPTALISAALPDTAAAVLSGPSFAADIARGLPTALSLACADADTGKGVREALSTPTFRLYSTTDVTGVELGGALKNVIAIACGAAMGAGLGESARAALMTRGLAEIMRLAAALGARPQTLMGLSGLGDLALTCASPQSRNFALGHALGSGTPPSDATAEGRATAQAALGLAAAHDIDMPITAAVTALVAGETSVKDAMQSLLDRNLTTE